MRKYNVAVVGATGLVGGEMMKVLLQRNFPIEKFRAFASERSEGRQIKFGTESVTVEKVTHDSFKGLDIVLFAGGDAAGSEFAPEATEAGAFAIDNSAAFRMDPNVPLVVPEVNPHVLSAEKKLIANPNCSTIQMLLPLKAIYDAVGLKRVIVVTYQSVAGTGKAAIAELTRQSQQVLNGEECTPEVYPHQIAFNLIPQIGSFGKNGYSSEEMKMILETQKIFGDDTIALSATTVRVPVMRGHAESVNIETKKKITATEVKKLLSKFSGITVVDTPEESIYPTPLLCEGRDDVFVGRIREDLSCANGIEMWIAADNLLKGAALNAVQIAELLIKKELIK